MKKQSKIKEAKSEIPTLPAKMPERIIFDGVKLQFPEGVWHADGIPVPKGQRWIIDGWFDLMQHWENNKVIEEITEHPLPDLNELNDAIPRSQWQTDGRPPWSHTHVVKMFDQVSATTATFASGSFGAKRAFDALVSSIEKMSRLRGAAVAPIIELAAKPMPTKYRAQPIPRPHYEIVGWIPLNGPVAAQALAPPKTPPGDSDPGDEIPF